MNIRNITVLETLMTVQGIFKKLSESSSARYYRIGFLNNDVEHIRARLLELSAHIEHREPCINTYFSKMQVVKWELPGERSGNLSMIYLEAVFNELISFLLTTEELHEVDASITGDNREVVQSLLDTSVSILRTNALFFQDKVVVNLANPVIGTEESMEKDALADLMEAADANNEPRIS